MSGEETAEFGILFRLIEKIGRQKAMDLLLTSRVLTSEECVNVGLAKKKVSSKNFLKDTLEWLEEYIKHDYQIIRSFKRLVNTYEDTGVDGAFYCENEMTKNLWGGEKHIEQINEFRKKISTSKVKTEKFQETS